MVERNYVRTRTGIVTGQFLSRFVTSHFNKIPKGVFNS